MKKYLLSFVTMGLSLVAFHANAVKSWPGMLQSEQPDGSIIEYRLVGDEFYHEMVSDDGYILKRTEEGLLLKTDLFDNDKFLNHQNERRAPMRLINENFPTHGNLKGIVILVEFADNAFQDGHNVELYHSLMNEPGFAYHGATGSVRDYFIDQSSGVFTPDFDVFGPVKLSRNMSYYGQNNSMGSDSHPEKMVSEACKYLEEQENVDFSKYDYDEDGVVDFVYIFYAGYAESYGASSNTIWPHSSNLTLLGEYCEVSGKRVDRYACSSELKYVSGNTLEGIGTFCHEFSHVIGLPDMYHTSNPASYQVGAWDLMDQGNYNNDSHTPPSMSAFERYSLKWLELTELDTPSDRVELPEMTSSNFAYRVSTPIENEYFTLENRQQEGWDAYQPSKGMMIIHITYEPSAWSGNFVNSGIIQRYDLVEADGIQSSGTAAGDLFPYRNVDSFTDYTSPSSMTWNGTLTEKGITMICDEDGLITFKFMKDKYKTPVIDEVTEIGSDYFLVSWNAPDDADSYSIKVREILSYEDNPVILDENFEKMTDGNYPNGDYLNISDMLDDYTHATGWKGTEVYQAGGYVQIGRYGESGKLISPVVDYDESVGFYTLTSYLVSYPGKSVNYSVKIIGETDGSQLHIEEGKVNKNGETILFSFENPRQSFYIVYETTNERMFIDNIRLAKGELSDEEIWNAGPKSWEITATSEEYPDGRYNVKVDNLLPNMNYAFSVMANSSNGMHSSNPTEEIIVTTASEETYVETVKNSKVISRKYLDINGLTIDSDAKGFKIIIETFEDGSIHVVKTIN